MAFEIAVIRTVWGINDHPRSGWLDLLPKMHKYFSAFNGALAIPLRRDLYVKK
jgi:hypothetical protein